VLQMECYIPEWVLRVVIMVMTFFGYLKVKCDLNVSLDNEFTLNVLFIYFFSQQLLHACAQGST